MRASLTLLLVALAFCAHAQNWALLNPAYRYNYSNDGTDTISNQIRVMDIDTLGVDSFRYELNLIGVVCDTCPASLGGPCNGCFVRVNQPQFLGYNCVHSGNNWNFQGKDTLLIQSDAEVGASWMFHAAQAITATVDAEWGENVLGVPDTLQRILLSDGDSILLSKSLGLVLFDHETLHHGLVGVEGAGVGRLFPDVLDYFDYEVGDELTYDEGAVYLMTFPGGPSGIPYPLTRYWKIIITGRSEIPDGVLYSTSIASTSITTGGGWASGPVFSCTGYPQLNQWSFTRSQILSQHPILEAYPGQILDTAVCWLGPGWQDHDTRQLAQMSISSSGKTIMRSKDIYVLNEVNNIRTGAFDGEDAVATNTFPALPIRVNQFYEEDLGLRIVEYSEMNYTVLRKLIGAVIGGDTIIPPPTINWTVSTPEAIVDDFDIFPNPASTSTVMRGFQKSGSLAILDAQGRMVLSKAIFGTTVTVDVQDLAPGIYLISVDGMLPQRLMIAR